jgi:hypothetical protein
MTEAELQILRRIDGGARHTPPIYLSYFEDNDALEALVQAELVQYLNGVWQLTVKGRAVMEREL